MTLALLLPYHPFDRPTPVPKGYDSTFYPRAWKMCRKKYAIVRANRYMVDRSGYLIAFYLARCQHPVSSWNTPSRREEKGLIHVQNLADVVR